MLMNVKDFLSRDFRKNKGETHIADQHSLVFRGHKGHIKGIARSAPLIPPFRTPRFPPLGHFHHLSECLRGGWVVVKSLMVNI